MLLTEYHPLNVSSFTDDHYIRLAEAHLQDQTSTRVYRRCFEQTTAGDDLFECYKRKLTDYRHIIQELNRLEADRR